MPVSSAALERLGAIPNVTLLLDAPLCAHTRFKIGGPAAVLCDAPDAKAFVDTLKTVQELSLPRMVIGRGTNLMVSDHRFEGAVLRYTAARIARLAGMALRVESG